jgi:hypothetical protein
MSLLIKNRLVGGRAAGLARRLRILPDSVYARGSFIPRSGNLQQQRRLVWGRSLRFGARDGILHKPGAHHSLSFMAVSPTAVSIAAAHLVASFNSALTEGRESLDPGAPALFEVRMVRVGVPTRAGRTGFKGFQLGDVAGGFTDINVIVKPFPGRTVLGFARADGSRAGAVLFKRRKLTCANAHMADKIKSSHELGECK